MLVYLSVIIYDDYQIVIWSQFGVLVVYIFYFGKSTEFLGLLRLFFISQEQWWWPNSKTEHTKASWVE